MSQGWSVAAGVLAAVALPGLIVCFFILWRARRSLSRINEAAKKYSEGQLDYPLHVDRTLKLNELAQTLRLLSRQLDDRFNDAVNRRNELEGVLASMVEGVLAVDREERVISLNRAAAALLEIDAQTALGKRILEVVRNTALQQFVAQMLASESPMQRELTLRTSETRPGSAAAAERHVQLQGAALRDSQGRWIGVLIVLHDITPLRRIESIRRDFVANVSHEIKTPVAAIRSSVETIQDNPDLQPGEVQRFLDIIHRQADHLHALVEDLLSLARLEQDGYGPKIATTPTPVHEVLTAALEACQFQAQDKRITVSVDCDPAIKTPMNAHLIRHAVINLLDNAIKYSPENTEVKMTVRRAAAASANGTTKPAPGELVISVTDQGAGIEPEHLPRIFERFYRPDKARSRSTGGTGLGLAIVKHTAQMHSGRVSVDSTPGKGSTFHIHLPLT